MNNDIRALTADAECSWDYIDRLRMALAAACKERDELKADLFRICKNPGEIDRKTTLMRWSGKERK